MEHYKALLTYTVSNNEVRRRLDKLSKCITDNGLSELKYLKNMNFIDYYFYRVYMIFIKRKEFARASTCILFCELFLTALFFILIFTTHYITGNFFIKELQSYKIYLILFGAPILFGIIIYKYYSKKRIKELLIRYKDSKYNKTISDRLIKYVTHIELTIGLIIWFIIANM